MERGSGLDDIPRTMPAMLEAGKLGSRAAKVGFDWPEVEGLFEKLEEEIGELRAEVDRAGASGASQRVEEEMGDLLFTAVNLARHLKVDAESALRGGECEVSRRFRAMERSAGGFEALRSLGPEELEALWERGEAGTTRQAGGRTFDMGRKQADGLRHCAADRRLRSSSGAWRCRSRCGGTATAT